MIEKMQFLSITGPKADIDRVVDQYLSRYEIHLENALASLQSVQNLSPFIQVNPYRETLNQAEELVGLLQDQTVTPASVSLEEAAALVENLKEQLSQIQEQRTVLEERRQKLLQRLEESKPFQGLDFDVDSILDFKFIKFRFGRIPKEYYAKFENYIYANFDTLFCKCLSNEEYIWGVYFCPKSEALKIDAVYSSMHFERIYLSEQFHGSPESIYRDLTEQIADLDRLLEENQAQAQEPLQTSAAQLLGARNRLASHSQNFDVRRLAACTKEDRETFYILCGWMSKKDAAAFQKEIEADASIYCFVEEGLEHHDSEPPVKLKNPKLFKPFEMYVKMYGLPAYNEMDPTIFVGVTYSLIFGAMFGDVGQGLLLLIGGALLYRFKKITLAAIISLAGIFSTFFGFMFGSVFGFEDVLPAYWLRPVTAMTQVPGLGNMNTVFVVAIAFGMFLILITMVLHIINAVRAHDIENILFDQNAVCGLVFYGSLTAVVALFVTGHHLPATIVLVVMFVVPLILIMFKEPLTRLMEKKTPVIEGGKVMFFVQSFFELFEVMLSYLSNTLSFVRIGAFAVSHAAMMEVVLMLGGATEGGSINWVIIVLGNLFVCAMEGLIVGIQVLRLEYYEMFSRFYKGSGREFRPFIQKNANGNKSKEANH